MRDLDQGHSLGSDKCHDAASDLVQNVLEKADALVRNQDNLSPETGELILEMRTSIKLLEEGAIRDQPSEEPANLMSTDIRDVISPSTGGFEICDQELAAEGSDLGRMTQQQEPSIPMEIETIPMSPDGREAPDQMDNLGTPEEQELQAADQKPADHPEEDEAQPMQTDDVLGRPSLEKPGSIGIPENLAYSSEAGYYLRGDDGLPIIEQPGDQSSPVTPVPISSDGVLAMSSDDLGMAAKPMSPSGQLDPMMLLPCLQDLEKSAELQIPQGYYLQGEPNDHQPPGSEDNSACSPSSSTSQMELIIMNLLKTLKVIADLLNARYSRKRSQRHKHRSNKPNDLMDSDLKLPNQHNILLDWKSTYSPFNEDVTTSSLSSMDNYYQLKCPESDGRDFVQHQSRFNGHCSTTNYHRSSSPSKRHSAKRNLSASVESVHRATLSTAIQSLRQIENNLNRNICIKQQTSSIESRMKNNACQQSQLHGDCTLIATGFPCLNQSDENVKSSRHPSPKPSSKQRSILVGQSSKQPVTNLKTQEIVEEEWSAPIIEVDYYDKTSETQSPEVVNQNRMTQTSRHLGRDKSTLGTKHKSHDSKASRRGRKLGDHSELGESNGVTLLASSSLHSAKSTFNTNRNCVNRELGLDVGKWCLAYGESSQHHESVDEARSHLSNVYRTKSDIFGFKCHDESGTVSHKTSVSGKTCSSRHKASSPTASKNKSTTDKRGDHLKKHHSSTKHL